MSYEADQEHQDGANGADGSADGEGVDDLTMALHGGGDGTFITESKQPMSKGTMAVAGLLVACGAITYFMYVRNGPAEAMADPTAIKAEETINSFIKAGSSKAKEWEDLIKSTDRVVQQFKTEPVQVTKLENNPFERVKPKPTADQALLDAARKKELAAARAKEAVNDLKLQTIIHPNPKRATCMINNALYRKGQKITVGNDDEKTTFTVDEIRPDGVTVSAMAGDEPVKFELKMKKFGL